VNSGAFIQRLAQRGWKSLGAEKWQVLDWAFSRYQNGIPVLKQALFAQAIASLRDNL
jgi:hypothetical protein